AALTSASPAPKSLTPRGATKRQLVLQPEVQGPIRTAVREVDLVEQQHFISAAHRHHNAAIKRLRYLKGAERIDLRLIVPSLLNNVLETDPQRLAARGLSRQYPAGNPLRIGIGDHSVRHLQSDEMQARCPQLNLAAEVVRPGRPRRRHHWL